MPWALLSNFVLKNLPAIALAALLGGSLWYVQGLRGEVSTLTATLQTTQLQLADANQKLTTLAQQRDQLEQDVKTAQAEATKIRTQSNKRVQAILQSPKGATCEADAALGYDFLKQLIKERAQP